MSKFMACLEADSSITAEQMKLSFLLEEMDSLDPVEEWFGDKFEKAKKYITEKLNDFIKLIMQLIDAGLEKIKEFKIKIRNKINRADEIHIKNLKLNYDYETRKYSKIINKCILSFNNCFYSKEAIDLYDEFKENITSCSIEIKDKWIKCKTFDDWANTIASELNTYKSELKNFEAKTKQYVESADKAYNKNDKASGDQFNDWSKVFFIRSRFYKRIVTDLNQDSSAIMQKIINGGD